MLESFGTIIKTIELVVIGISIFILFFYFGKLRGKKLGREEEKIDNLKETVKTSQEIKSEIDKANNVTDDSKRCWLHDKFPRD